MSITVTQLGAALGAELSGIKLNADLSDSDISDIRNALLEHQVIRIRNQQLDDDALKQLGLRFGELVIHPNLVAVGRHPEVIRICKEPHADGIVGAEWHTDTTCLAKPPMGAILHAIDVPSLGGDTLFANQYMAFDALSVGMQAMLCKMRAVHNDTRVAGPQAALNAQRTVQTREVAWQKTEHVHPVVHTHPETGKRALYVNIAYTRNFENMTQTESAPLLGFLMAHAVRHDFSYRFQWQRGDVLFWDNRCVKHIAMNDYPGYRREMSRVQITGHKPYLA